MTAGAVPFVKICGIRSRDEAALALDCGATAIGFLVGLSHVAEDATDEITARDIVGALPAATNTVLVTHLLDVHHIAALAAFIGVRTIQIHDDVPADDLRTLRVLAAGKTIMKAVHVTGAEAIEKALHYAVAADGLLLDSRTRTRLGGTGQPHDWSISAQIVTRVAPCPVYLAGGLTPDNVARAVMQVRPAGVDVNSGVEDAAGAKDRSRVAAFVTAALRHL